ncbi:MAG: periplasmic heavy metal sensor [Deltaproteobacteria bacterium]|nr:periplasmic heavy metal sensor [Deltaproteobacteria bacterium]
MAPAEASPRKIRLLTALVLFGTFVVGVIGGAGLCRWLGPPAPPHPPPHFQPGHLGPFAELGLSGEQERRAREIMERHRPELEAILHETFPKVRAINERMARELREVLTPEQRSKLDEIEARRPPPPPPGFPPPPPPPFGIAPPPPPPFGILPPPRGQ